MASSARPVSKWTRARTYRLLTAPGLRARAMSHCAMA